MVQSLDKKWKEFLYAFAGFGPNFLMILMGAYYSDAINPAALEAGEQFQAILPGFCFIMPALFPILFAIGKIFDGIIDIPFAYITDTLSTRWGRRRPAIAVCAVPMAVSFALCWIMPMAEEYSLFNTLWVSLWSIVFFAAYTMCLIAFYGSLSTVCTSEPQRLRVSGYKSFFDTISYCLVYALVPVILSGAGLQIDVFVFVCLPMMATIVIPLFLIKEGKKYGYPENTGLRPEKISLWESLKLTFQNRVFRRWLYVNCCTFFGLQMFLSAMNGMIIGGMGLTGGQMAVLNTFAFAPVPVMLYMFNKVKARWGVRRAYQSCLILFAIAILSFFFASRFMLGEGNLTPKMIIGIFGGLCASWSIGVFFMMPYLAAAQIAGVETKLLGRDHSAMYFAGNAVVTSIVGAVSGNLVYEYLKNVFMTHDFRFAWATSAKSAADALGATPETVFNFGNLVVPFIVCITCLLGFFLAFLLPHDFKPTLLAAEFKRQDPSLDVSSVKDDAEEEEKGEIVFVQVGLTVLSGFLFGFLWQGFLLGAVKRLAGLRRLPLWYLLGAVVPFGSAAVLFHMRRRLLTAAEERGISMKISPLALLLSTLFLPLAPMNAVALGILQSKVNLLLQSEAKEA